MGLSCSVLSEDFEASLMPISPFGSGDPALSRRAAATAVAAHYLFLIARQRDSESLYLVLPLGSATTANREKEESPVKNTVLVSPQKKFLQ